MSEVIGYIKNGEIVDTQSAQSGDKEVLFDNSKEALEIIRHSAFEKNRKKDERTC